MKKGATKYVWEGTFDRILEPSFAGAAAEVAFWLILSMAPASILFAQVLQFFTFSMEAAKKLLTAYVSGEVYDIIAPLFEYSSLKSMTILFIILALWAGSSAVFSLMRILNRAYGFVPKIESTVAQYFIGRLRAMLMTLLMLATIIFALFILVYGEVIVNTALSYSNDFLGNHYSFSEVWFGVRWIIAFILFFFMVFSIYYTLPFSSITYRDHFTKSKLLTIKQVFMAWLKNRRLEYLRAMPGTFFSAVAMLITTRVYTLFVRNVMRDNMNIIYGGLSSVVVLLIWFYVIALILVIGVQVNAAYAEYAAREDQELEQKQEQKQKQEQEQKQDDNAD